MKFNFFDKLRKNRIDEAETKYTKEINNALSSQQLLMEHNFKIFEGVNVNKEVYVFCVNALCNRLTEYGVDLTGAKLTIHIQGNRYPETERKFPSIVSLRYPELSYIICFFETEDNIYMLDDRGSIISSDSGINRKTAFDLKEETERLFEGVDVGILLEKAADEISLDGNMFYRKSTDEFLEEIEIEPENPFGLDPCSSWVKVPVSVEKVRNALVHTSIKEVYMGRDKGIAPPYILRKYLINREYSKNSNL